MRHWKCLRKLGKVVAAVAAIVVVGLLALFADAELGAAGWGSLALFAVGVTVAELREKAAKCVGDSRAVYEKAKGETRDLSAEEAEQTGKLLDEAERLRAEADTLARLEGLETDMARSRGRRADPDGPGDSPFGAPSATRWVDADSGRLIGVYAPDESIAGDSPDDRLDLGLLVRGMVCGKWVGAERERRALAEGVGTAGGYTVPEPLAPHILDLARARSVCIAAGMQTVPMAAESLTIARMTADPTASWRAENSEIAESEPTFGAFLLTADSLAVVCKVSLELVADSPNIGQVVENALAQACGLGLDYAALMGTGALQPTGVYNDADVQELTAIAIPDMDDFVDAHTALQEENHEPTAIILHPRFWGIVNKLKDGEGHYLEFPECIRNLKRLSSTQIPLTLGVGENESVGFVGDFSKLLLGLRQAVTLEASREASDSTSSAFRNAQVWIRAMLRADVCVSYEKAFVVLRGMTTA